MSRIGKMPIAIPKGVDVSVAGSTVTVKGKLGTLDLGVESGVEVKHESDPQSLVVSRSANTKRHRALHGLTRALLNNMVTGVSKGFSKRLEIIGTGYNAKLANGELTLQIGFCHPVNMPIPEGLEVKVPNPTRVEITGADKQLVGQFAANVRGVRPPEVYKGKGIKYQGEIIRRKAGKALGDKK